MPERSSNGGKFSRRELFSHFKPKKISEDKPVKGTKESVDPWRLKLTRRELFNSVAVGSSLAFFDIALIVGLDKYDVPVGSSTNVVEDLPNPLALFALGSIIAPAAEEAMFRALPSEIFAKISADMRWGVGAGSALAFALSHNLKGNMIYPTGISTERIPATQFISGLFYWKLVRDGGYANAFVAHSAHNTTLLLLWMAGK